MKYILLPFLLVSSMAFAQTTILFDDGSTLTLRDGEEVYVSEYGVYKARGGLVKTLKIERMKPTEKRDYVAPPPSEPVPCDGTLTFGGVCIEEVVEEEEECVEDPFTFGGSVCVTEEEEEEEEVEGGGFTFGG